MDDYEESKDNDILERPDDSEEEKDNDILERSIPFFDSLKCERHIVCQLYRKPYGEHMWSGVFKFDIMFRASVCLFK